MANFTDRELGNMEARVVLLEQELGAVRDDTRKILLTLSEAQGGWKTLMMPLRILRCSWGLSYLKFSLIFRNNLTCQQIHSQQNLSSPPHYSGMIHSTRPRAAGMTVTVSGFVTTTLKISGVGTNEFLVN